MRKKILEDINPLDYELSTAVYASPKQQADRLISLGKGVYKDKVSNKLLYNYDEMPTATVVGHKKKKSVNDNLQAAYAKGIPSGTMSADMETMNAVTGGTLNLLSPSQIIGAGIHSDRPQDYFLNLIKGNNGIVTDKFAQEHPYWTIAANGALDAFTGRTLYNINYWNQTRPLTTAIAKGLGKTVVEVPYNILTNNDGYVRDIMHPVETVKAIKDGRYTPLFLTKSRAKNAFIKNRNKLQNIFDDAYEFNKKYELNKIQPIDIEEQNKININNIPSFFKTKNMYYGDVKPKLHLNPLKNKPGQNFYRADGYYGNKGNVYIPSRTSKHILTDANSNHTKRVLAHEINHHIQHIIPKYRGIAIYDPNIGYYKVNEAYDLANKTFAPIKKNSNSPGTAWAGNPNEVQSELAGNSYILNNPNTYINQPKINKDFIKNYMSKRFYISEDEADKMLNDMSRNSFALGGYVHR